MFLVQGMVWCRVTSYRIIPHLMECSFLRLRASASRTSSRHTGPSSEEQRGLDPASPATLEGGQQGVMKGCGSVKRRWRGGRGCGAAGVGSGATHAWVFAAVWDFGVLPIKFDSSESQHGRAAAWASCPGRRRRARRSPVCSVVRGRVRRAAHEAVVQLLPLRQHPGAEGQVQQGWRAGFWGSAG